jgi:hypothetical protein
LHDQALALADPEQSHDPFAVVGSRGVVVVVCFGRVVGSAATGAIVGIRVVGALEVVVISTVVVVRMAVVVIEVSGAFTAPVAAWTCTSRVSRPRRNARPIATTTIPGSWRRRRIVFPTT